VAEFDAMTAAKFSTLIPPDSIAKVSRRTAVRQSEALRVITQSFHDGLSWDREGAKPSLYQPDLPWP
jgi:hypothetical protein